MAQLTGGMVKMIIPTCNKCLIKDIRVTEKLNNAWSILKSNALGHR